VAIALVVAAEKALGNELLSRAFNQCRKQFNVVACALTWKDLLKEVVQHQLDVAGLSATRGQCTC